MARKTSAAAKTRTAHGVGVPADLDRLGDRTYAQLKADIVGCVLAPGEEVSESRLAERYGVGKAPVRTSLARLRQEGWVEPLPRRGYLIAPITIRDVQEVYQARNIIESQVARLAAGGIDVDQLRRLDEAIQVGYEPGDQESETRFLEANRTFHLTIAEASGNRRLRALLGELLQECDRILHLAMRLDSSAEQRFRHGHEQIIEALRTGDAEAAEHEVTSAVLGGRDLVLAVLFNSTSLMDAGLQLPGVRRAAR